jgi:ElaA protein
MITWRCAPFPDLTPREIHDMFQARSAAFVVEQTCVFLDIDGIDPQCWHLVGYAEGARDASVASAGAGVSTRSLVACARLVPPAAKYAEPSIGRVVTTAAVRGTGVGRELMGRAIAHAEELWPGQPIRIGAQQHLEKFYASLGFATASAPYDEDGIPHIEMLRPALSLSRRSARIAGQ